MIGKAFGSLPKSNIGIVPIGVLQTAKPVWENRATAGLVESWDRYLNIGKF